MLEPEQIDVATPAAQLRVLSWGPEEAPIALCLHGFPDTAHGWRNVAPVLVDAGWRVVAPFMRGYAPSSLPKDGSHHIGALMDDALRVLDALGATGRDVIVGHDWGAMAATGLAAMPDSPFTRAVIMSVPPSASFRPPGGKTSDVGRLVATLPAQLRRSWYILYFQLPWLPERSTRWIVPRLWRKWSPGYHADEDVRHVQAAIGAPDRWRAALKYYRTVIRNTKVPAQYAELHDNWLAAPRISTLYLHGRDDGCATADYANWVEKILPDGSEVAIVDRAGHFLQLEQPDLVGRRIADFIGPAS